MLCKCRIHTQIPKRTLFTKRISRPADIPSELNNLMAISGRSLRWKHHTQILLYLFGQMSFCKPQSAGNADAMGIGHNSRLSVDITQQEICSFSADSR